jgi:tetratricopeptide (TPR) repeat protein
MNWSAALGHLQSVATVTNDAYLRYLSQYFIGRTFHEMGNAASAVQAFERAVAIVPSARAASTHLAVELFLSDRAADRDRAYPLLQAAYADTALDDPWRLYLHGDAWLWPSYMTKLREALR